MRFRRAAALTLAAVLGSALLAGCTDGEPTKPHGPEAISPTKLTLGVYAEPTEMPAYRRVINAWNEQHPDVQVSLTSVGDRDQQLAYIQDPDKPVPDLFLISRRDLPYVTENAINQPVDELLDARDTRFSDSYSRQAILAFSSDSRLQCMPYGVSPMVVYYNTKLVDFDKMAARGMDVPDLTVDNLDWTFDQFAAAARFASRRKNKAAGVYIDPTLRSLAPFVYSGGGKLFDDEEHPTSLAFSDEDSRSALTTTLGLLRNPLVTLNDQQLNRRDAVEWFKKGRLGMITGFRDLTPQLRQVKGLDFDVMPMPYITDRATVGDLTGLCMNADVERPGKAADFMAYLLNDESLTTVSQAGYLVPANTDVSAGDGFLQPLLLPAHANVFNTAQRYIVLPPLIPELAHLDSVVNPDIERLFSTGYLNLDAVTARIDEDSRTVLDPESGASPSESGEPTG